MKMAEWAKEQRKKIYECKRERDSDVTGGRLRTEMTRLRRRLTERRRLTVKLIRSQSRRTRADSLLLSRSH